MESSVLSDRQPAAPAVKVRPVSEHDAEEIARLDQQLTGRWRPEHWEQRIVFACRRDPESSLVALSEGGLVGYLFADVRGPEFGFPTPTGWLDEMGVSPAERGRSVGQTLLQHSLQHLRRGGALQVRTLVWEQHSELRSFFEHQGFTPEPATVLGRTLETE